MRGKRLDDTSNDHVLKVLVVWEGRVERRLVPGHGHVHFRKLASQRNTAEKCTWSLAVPSSPGQKMEHSQHSSLLFIVIYVIFHYVHVIVWCNIQLMYQSCSSVVPVSLIQNQNHRCRVTLSDFRPRDISELKRLLNIWHRPVACGTSDITTQFESVWKNDSSMCVLYTYYIYSYIYTHIICLNVMISSIHSVIYTIAINIISWL